MKASARPCPPDFAEQHARLTRRALLAHYETSPRCINRWQHETGLFKSKNGNERRPMPADFAEVAATKKTDALCQHFEAGADTVKRWRQESGIYCSVPARVRQKEAAPADFATIAPTLTLDQAVTHFHRKRTTLRRWEVDTGVRMMRKAPTLRPMPTDFVERHAEMQLTALARHYRTSTEVTTRWAAEAGVKRAQNTRIRKAVPFVRAAPERRKIIGAPNRTAPVDRTQRDMSSAGQAADFLRRFAPVVRCDAAGRYSPAGDHWRRGSSVLTAAEIVERAERLGFDPNAWSRIAA